MHRTGIAPRKDLPDPMSDQTTVSPAQSADGPGALRIIGLAAVGIGLAALAGAAFVLSYPGIHAFALDARVSARLARGYPLIFDVLLVVILAAVLALRGAGLPSKLLAWACLLALLSAAAGADALHAAGRKLPAQSAAVTAAIVPWVLVLIALALLLAMLRHARLRRLTGNRVAVRGRTPARWQTQQQPPASSLPLIPGFRPDESDVLTMPNDARQAAEIPRLDAPSPVVPAQVTAESAADAGLAPDDPSRDDAPVGPAAESTADPPGRGGGLFPAGHDGASQDRADGDDAEHWSGQEQPGDPDYADADAPEQGDDADPEMPVFHRMWSSPAPPTGQ